MITAKASTVSAAHLHCKLRLDFDGDDVQFQ